jgi:beta-mannosidase
MTIQSLSGAWEFRQSDSDKWLPAQVPGGVHSDLMNLGVIPDPFIADNESRVQWVAESDWSYRYKFRCPPNFFDQEKIFLVCDGLDTLAHVVLNGQSLGKTDNMFRKYEWEINSYLNGEQENELMINFSSPVKFISEKQAVRALPGVAQAIPGSPHLRKAPCQFGWDWGPQLPPIGIWKGLRLEGYQVARFSNIHLKQVHEGGIVTVVAKIETQRYENEPIAAGVRITSPLGEIFDAKDAIPDGGELLLQISISNPELWWPNGYGEQPLYHVETYLECEQPSGQILLDQKKFQLGLRTLELRQEPDQWGRSFEFLVNGVPIMCKGSNWIPADSLPTRISDEHLETLIRAAAQTHQNMLRVWGGGFYEEERFYDLCDQYGILVWQDFIFSCSIYPLDDPAFLENVKHEAVENIRRLRHRASLALWCGNNEMEWGWVDWGWNQPQLQDLKNAYDQFFHHTLPEWCQVEDPDTPYWPSSPSSDTPFENPNGQIQGDSHYWDVWHGRKPFTAYRDQFPRFMSEFGFQALPPLATIQTFADEEDWNMTSYVMEQHQKNASGNSLLVGQMLDTFRLPRDFSSLVYLSMALQAEGIRYGVEHWRRYPERVAGIIYWQLNDCWPVASWSSLDYFGRWKALHYAARRFYQPVMLSVEDQPYRQAIHISNDLLVPFKGDVNWSLETHDGSILSSGQLAFTVAPQSAALVCDLDFKDQVTSENRRNLVFVAELWQSDHLLSMQTAYFAPIKYLALSDPGLQVELNAKDEELVVVIKSHTLALLVELSFMQADVVFSDNYFNIPAGREIEISCTLPTGWTLERAVNDFRMRSVYDSFAHTSAS